uniref:non-specific serine/threonine protein kinase n=1 Tax=viral metagenome TaxID=1070528 RepID=A0A6C0JXY2_9ZZZZ
MIIANKYRLIERLGNGGFGTIFKGENIRTTEQVAIKIEPISSETKMLKRETKIYQYLGKAQGIPQVKWFGTVDGYNYMVLPLLGDSLSSKTFSLTEALHIGQQMVKILKYIHEKYLIHRDIKPDNFVLSQDGSILYIIDFGLCKKYIDTEHRHIKMRTDRTLVGTPNFVSVNVHNGIEPTRRDDLISVAYVILYMVNGGVPWQVPRDNEFIKMQKMCILQWSKIPKELLEYLNYCNCLKFDETPDYDFLINTLYQLI